MIRAPGPENGRKLAWTAPALSRAILEGAETTLIADPAHSFRRDCFYLSATYNGRDSLGGTTDDKDLPGHQHSSEQLAGNR